MGIDYFFTLVARGRVSSGASRGRSEALEVVTSENEGFTRLAVRCPSTVFDASVRSGQLDRYFDALVAIASTMNALAGTGYTTEVEEPALAPEQFMASISEETTFALISQQAIGAAEVAALVPQTFRITARDGYWLLENIEALAFHRELVMR